MSGHADATHFVQEGSLLDEVTRRQQTQTPLTSQEILHIFLQVKLVTVLLALYKVGKHICHHYSFATATLLHGIN